MEHNWPGDDIPQANGGAANNPDAEADDDFGGFEAAEPMPPNIAQPTEPAEAGSSPWAVFASGGGTFRQPDLLCAQNAFPQYLDPSGISGAPNHSSQDPHHEGGQPPFEANFDLNHDQQLPAASDQARIAENVLDGTLNAANRNLASPEVAHSPASPAPLPDLGIGGSGLPLRREPPADIAEGAAAPVAAEVEAEAVVENRPEQVAVPEVSNDVPPQRPDINEAQLNEQAQATSQQNETLKRDLETLTEQNQKLEEALAKTTDDLEKQKTRLDELQERHHLELEEVKKAGHDALTVVVEEYKDLSRTVVLEQQQVSLQQLQEALKQQAQCFQQMMKEQAEDLKVQHEAELKQQDERSKEAQATTSKEQQEKFDQFMCGEREKHTAQIQQALEAEREESRKLMEAAIEAEREKAEQKLEKEREKLTDVSQEVKETCKQDLRAALEEERVKQQAILASTLEEERESGKEKMRESQKSAQEDVQTYIQEQRQRDSLLRQRHLTTLDLFLSSARQQLQLLSDCETETMNQARPEFEPDQPTNKPSTDDKARTEDQS